MVHLEKSPTKGYLFCNTQTSEKPRYIVFSTMYRGFLFACIQNEKLAAAGCFSILNYCESLHLCG